MESSSLSLINKIVLSEDYLDNIRNCNKEFMSLILKKETIHEIFNTLIPQESEINSNCNNVTSYFNLNVIQKQILQIFTSDEILCSLSADSNVILYLENYIKKYIVVSNDQIVQSNVCTANFQQLSFIIKKLCLASNGNILQYVNKDSQLTVLLINYMVNLLVVDLSTFLFTNYFKFMHFEEYLIQKLISLATASYMKNHSSMRLFCALIFIQKLIKSSSHFKSIICDISIVGNLLVVASNEIFDTNISKMALDIVAFIADHSKNADVQLIIQSFEPEFSRVQIIQDPRTSVLLHLYNSRVYNLMIPFLEEKTTTFINSEIFLIIKRMNNDQLQKILNLKNFLHGLMQKFDENRINGHLTKLAQILIERSSSFSQLKTFSWKRFQNTIAIPRIQKFTSNYGGHPDSFSTSYANDSPPLKNQLKKILEDEDDIC